MEGTQKCKGDNKLPPDRAQYRSKDSKPQPLSHRRLRHCHRSWYPGRLPSLMYRQSSCLELRFDGSRTLSDSSTRPIGCHRRRLCRLYHCYTALRCALDLQGSFLSRHSRYTPRCSYTDQGLRQLISSVSDSMSSDTYRLVQYRYTFRCNTRRSSFRSFGHILPFQP
jgi:hypothetical protein